MASTINFLLNHDKGYGGDLSNEGHEGLNPGISKARVGPFILTFNQPVQSALFLHCLKEIDNNVGNDPDMVRRIWTEKGIRLQVHNIEFEAQSLPQYKVTSCEFVSPLYRFDETVKAYTRFYSFNGYTFTFSTTIPRDYVEDYFIQYGKDYINEPQEHVKGLNSFLSRFDYHVIGFDLQQNFIEINSITPDPSRI